MYRRRKNIGVFVAVFLLAVVGISIGYAMITSNVEINGNTDIASNKWDIHFANLVVSNGSVNTTAENAAKINVGDSTKIEYNVSLSKPGEYYEFTVDVVNEGTIDGKIDVTDLSMTNVTTGENVDENHADPTAYAEYSVVDATTNQVLSKDEVLASGASRKIKIRVAYKYDLVAEDLPTKPQTLKLVYTLSYIQA